MKAKYSSPIYFNEGFQTKRKCDTKLERKCIGMSEYGNSWTRYFVIVCVFEILFLKCIQRKISTKAIQKILLL